MYIAQINFCLSADFPDSVDFPDSALSTDFAHSPSYHPQQHILTVSYLISSKRKLFQKHSTLEIGDPFN